MHSGLNIIKLNKIYPLSDAFMEKLMRYDMISVFEESEKSGGIGEHLAARLANSGYKGALKLHAVDNKFVPAAKVYDSIVSEGLDKNSMLKSFTEN